MITDKGREFDLARYRNKVVIIVNIASKCAFTYQLAELEALYKDLKATYPDDVEFIAFPCYQFGYSESETEQETQTFRATNYGVSFTILRKTDVNGEKASPLYQWMKSEMPGFMCSRRVKWNFEKFVIDRYGRVPHDSALAAPLPQENSTTAAAPGLLQDLSPEVAALLTSLGLGGLAPPVGAVVATVGQDVQMIPSLPSLLQVDRVTDGYRIAHLDSVFGVASP
ncbi:hypothetical protein KCU93_g1104, partial [Aureobasidium melanogenum]